MKNIIWDFNGTILNDGKLNFEITNNILKSLDKREIEYEHYLRMLEFPIPNFYKKLDIPHEGDKYEKLVSFWKDSYINKFSNCDLHIGIVEIFEDLNTKNTNQFILSALHEDYLHKITKHFQIESHFKQIIGAKSFDAPPKIKQGLDLIKAHQCDLQNTILIGDTTHDAEVADHLGIECLLISHGHQHYDTLIKTKYPVLTNLNELINKLN